jgi:hypothetical protein
MKQFAYLIWLLLLITSGCGQTSSTTTSSSGTNAPTLEDIATGLKWDCYMKTPKSPAYLPGEPTIIPVSKLAGLPSFVRMGISVSNANYLFCNLSPSQWAILGAQTPIHLLVWSPAPDASGGREVVTLDLKTSVVDIRTCSGLDFTNRLADVERVIRKGTGQQDFSLRASQTP